MNQLYPDMREGIAHAPGFVDSEDKNADIVLGAWRADVGKDTGYQRLTQAKSKN